MGTTLAGRRPFSRENEIIRKISIEERLKKYREEIRDAESKILGITGDLYEGFVFETYDTEIAQIESLNAKLLELIQQISNAPEASTVIFTPLQTFQCFVLIW